MELTLAVKQIKTEERKKSLGLIVSQNMNWTDHVNDTVKKCKFKLRSLKKLGGVVTEDQRKKLIEGVILKQTPSTSGGGEHGQKSGHRSLAESTQSSHDVDRGRKGEEPSE